VHPDRGAAPFPRRDADGQLLRDRRLGVVVAALDASGDGNETVEHVDREVDRAFQIDPQLAQLVVESLKGRSAGRKTGVELFDALGHAARGLEPELPEITERVEARVD